MKPIPGFKTRFIRGGMDVNLIVKNWRAINETPIKKAGLLVRTIMRGSIRRAYVSKRTGEVSQKPSPPGQPPRARYGIKPGAPSSGQYLPFKQILSVPFADNTKAVIGHKLLPIRKQDPQVTPMEAHEFGRRVRKRIWQRAAGARRKAYTDKQRRAARRLYEQGRLKSTPRQTGTWVTKTFRMPKRQFALPALTKASKRIGQFWKGIIKRAGIRS